LEQLIQLIRFGLLVAGDVVGHEEIGDVVVREKGQRLFGTRHDLAGKDEGLVDVEGEGEFMIIEFFCVLSHVAIVIVTY
jgi:hypothetical protein